MNFRSSEQPEGRRVVKLLDASCPEPTIGGMELGVRLLALGCLRVVFHAVQSIGVALLLLPAGPMLLMRWLEDGLPGWSGIVEALGGTYLGAREENVDAELGPRLAHREAPELLSEIQSISSRIKLRAQAELRVSYLPCCAVVQRGGKPILLVGLPLLPVLTRGEFRAVLAHELAHLALGDASWSAKLARFVEGLGRASAVGKSLYARPLLLWTRLCHDVGARLLGPVSRGQEARADRLAASIAGGGVAADALVKVALVQPIFREVVEHYESVGSAEPNIYALFRRFWNSLPPDTYRVFRNRLFSETPQPNAASSVHPPLLDRIRQLQSYPERPGGPLDTEPAAGLVCDLEALERSLHRRLFTLDPVRPSVFHRAGTPQ